MATWAFNRVNQPRICEIVDKTGLPKPHAKICYYCQLTREQVPTYSEMGLDDLLSHLEDAMNRKTYEAWRSTILEKVQEIGAVGAALRKVLGIVSLISLE